VNAPQYTEAELKQFAEDNERGITYNGKHYTLYQAGQEQATMENAIRNLRRQILADEETKSPDLQKHQIRLRVLQSEYTKFCKAANLPTRNERLQVAGFGRSQASKAVWTYRRSKVSDVQIQGHTLYSVTEERINAVPAPSFRGLTNKANGKAQGYARELLRKVQNKALGTEAIVDFTADGYVRYSVGASGKMQVASPELSVPYYSLHNHASNDILSPEDVQRLIKYPNMKGVGPWDTPVPCIPVRRCTGITWNGHAIGSNHLSKNTRCTRETLMIWKRLWPSVLRLPRNCEGTV
jgi:hypothetical protein